MPSLRMRARAPGHEASSMRRWGPRGEAPGNRMRAANSPSAESDGGSRPSDGGDLGEALRAVGVIAEPQRKLEGELLAANHRDDRCQRLRYLARERHVDSLPAPDDQYAR